MVNHYCRLCDGKFNGKTAILKHATQCIREQRSNEDAQSTTYTFLLTDKFKGNYFVVVRMNSESSLRTFDKFVRKLWMDCCGHSSMFEICGKTLFSLDDDFKRISLESLFGDQQVGCKFTYLYDMGSPTYAKCELIDVRKDGLVAVGDTVIVTRNSASPPPKCCECSGVATQVSTTDDVYVCDDCVYDEDSFLPIVNSPRCGFCGYCGSDMDTYTPPTTSVKQNKKKRKSSTNPQGSSSKRTKTK